MQKVISREETLRATPVLKYRKEDRTERNPDPKQVATEALADDVELEWALRVVPK